MSKKEQFNIQAVPGQPTQQVTKFYHKTLTKFASAVFEEDCHTMEAAGWRLTFATPLGQGPGTMATDTPIVAIYHK